MARDVGGFYSFHSLMTIAAYGLVVHANSESARHAGRVYLVMALLAEMLLLAAFLVLVIVIGGVSINASLVTRELRAKSRAQGRVLRVPINRVTVS